MIFIVVIVFNFNNFIFILTDWFWMGNKWVKMLQKMMVLGVLLGISGVAIADDGPIYVNGDRVGIGTTQPYGQLHVNWTVTATSFAGDVA